jgi:head-tail adaptor
VISAGRIRRFFATRLAASTAQDALGMRVNAWTEAGSFPCELRNDSTTESSYADGVAVRRMFEVRARWQAVANTGLTEVDRLQVGNRTLRITGIRNIDEMDRAAVISCEEIQ